MSNRRFEVVLNIPSPYRLHLLNVLWRVLKERNVELLVHFMAKGHPGHPKSWLNPKIEFPHRYWRDIGPGTHHFNPGLLFHFLLSRPKYALIGSPYDTFTTIFLSVLLRAQVKCAWVEGNPHKPGKLTGFIGSLKRFVLSRYGYVGVAGQASEDYINMHQSLTRRKLPKPVMLPNIVDETRFRCRVDWSIADIDACRKSLGADDKTRICVIPARLVWLKGLRELISELDTEMVKGWRIVIIGDGPLRAELMQLIKIKGLEDIVELKAFVPYEQMPLIYAASDLFLLPSLEDANPLCVVEALHSGLPIALSDQAGNAPEAVNEGVNGWILPVKDDNAFRRVLLNVFSTSLTELKRKGLASRENSKFWSSCVAMNNFVQKIFDSKAS